MRILLVEDDPSTARAIELMLTAASYNVFRTDMGEEGIDLAKLYDYDLILLDLDLPDMHGMEVLRHLRLARVDTPILILTGSDDTESKLRGFGFGADDYMTKPFNREELQARIQAIIRRSKGHSQAIIKTGEIVVNLDARCVKSCPRRSAAKAISKPSGAVAMSCANLPPMLNAWRSAPDRAAAAGSLRQPL